LLTSIDQRFAAEDEAAGIGAAEIFGADADEIGAAPHEVAHDRSGVVEIGGIDDHRNAARSGDLHHLFERQRTGLAVEMSGVKNGGGIGSDRRFELIGACAVAGTDFDELRAGHADLAVIFVAMAGLDKHVAFHAGRVGELLRLLAIGAGEAGGGAEKDGGGGTRRDARGPRRRGGRRYARRSCREARSCARTGR
jgi:hypothetical protein